MPCKNNKKPSRLIDKLPPERQAQAQELANELRRLIQPRPTSSHYLWRSCSKTKLENSLNRWLNHVQAADIGHLSVIH